MIALILSAGVAFAAKSTRPTGDCADLLRALRRARGESTGSLALQTRFARLFKSHRDLIQNELLLQMAAENRPPLDQMVRAAVSNVEKRLNLGK